MVPTAKCQQCGATIDWPYYYKEVPFCDIHHANLYWTWLHGVVT